MDNILFFGGESNDSTEDLPWLRDWCKQVTNPQEPQEVLVAYVGDKGILMETGLYKAFIFKKEKVHGYLLEALSQWVNTKQETFPLIISGTPKGKGNYGIHQDKPKVYWHQDENRFYSVRVSDGKPIPKLAGNPFLQPNNPATTPPQSEKPNSDRRTKPPKAEATEATTAA